MQQQEVDISNILEHASDEFLKVERRGMDISGIIGAIVSGLLYFLLGYNYFKQESSNAKERS